MHPTQKPIKLIEEIILRHTNEGDIILDPFSGSGSISIAALLNKRNYIACEINRDYFEKSIKKREIWKNMLYLL
ncbi:DNA methyltransferase [Mycoplasma leonicaptivi]|uniref:DNA methyltransferase n=1 Tax=Mycoplasma leonicaptivi TaxID=36742 RepID=UPI001B80B666